ncbi:MAG TPA: hypothetical protein VKR56_01380 [Candidatus Cybelea sp.]|nr:hypothetical protein [Candidatus Cybelea sp.]
MPFAPASATITVTPSKISLNSDGGAYSQNLGGSEQVVVAESGYTGEFSADLPSCNGVATMNSRNGMDIGKGPKITRWVYGLAPGLCTLTFSDAKKHTARLPISSSPWRRSSLRRERLTPEA